MSGKLAMRSRLIEALRPFAEYGEYMETKEPGWYKRGVYYGVKNCGAPQVKRLDFQEALRAIKADRNGRELANDLRIEALGREIPTDPKAFGEFVVELLERIHER